MGEVRSGARSLATVGATSFGLFASVSLALVTRLQWRRAQRRQRGWQCIGSSLELQPGPAGWAALHFVTDVDGVGACALLEMPEMSILCRSWPWCHWLLENLGLRPKQQHHWIAFNTACPHAGIDLLSGEIEDLGSGPVIACPAHTYLFDATTGTCLWDSSRQMPPSTPPMKTFEVIEECGEVWVLPKQRPSALMPEQWDQAAADELQMEMVNRALERKFPD